LSRPGDLDVRVALVVLEPDVVSRAVLLDEFTLEDQGLDLGVGDDKVKVVSMGHEFVRLAVTLRGGVKIRANPVSQVNRLADIDHATVLVAVDIDAWLCWQAV